MAKVMKNLGLNAPEDIQSITNNWSKSKKVKHVLSKFKEAGKTIPNLNQGGCAIIAYGIAEYSGILGIDAKVVYLFNEYSNRDYNRLKHKTGNGSCSHAVVDINGKLYDSEGEFDFDEYFGKRSSIDSLELTNKQVKESISYRKHWNKRFDRRAGKKQIQKILGIPIKIKQKPSK